MTPHAMLPRRGFVAAAIGVAPLWLAGRAGFRAMADRFRPAMPGYQALAALAAALDCPATIGAACLRALPENEAAIRPLAQAILANLPSTAFDGLSPAALAPAIRQQIRDDFRDDRMMTVDGWMLSQTETRMYALAALQPRRAG